MVGRSFFAARFFSTSFSMAATFLRFWAADSAGLAARPRALPGGLATAPTRLRVLSSPPAKANATPPAASMNSRATAIIIERMRSCY